MPRLPLLQCHPARQGAYHEEYRTARPGDTTTTDGSGGERTRLAELCAAQPSRCGGGTSADPHRTPHDAGATLEYIRSAASSKLHWRSDGQSRCGAPAYRRPGTS